MGDEPEGEMSLTLMKRSCLFEPQVRCLESLGAYRAGVAAKIGLEDLG